MLNKKNNLPKIYENAKDYINWPGFPRGVSNEQAFVPTGMYLGWLIENDLISEYFLEETPKSELENFKKGNLSGPKIYKLWGGILMPYMLSEKGQKFSDYYFSTNPQEVGKYFFDYKNKLAKKLPNLFEAKDSQENYKKISKVINKRFKKWRKNNSQKKWWKFWE
ncbi:MAG: hypothetical protein GF335_04775 [Candidatus Moranbacteria bacterium]|nr:hypothetical protein [Candidatus Moranbacteria bacterium]